MKQRLAEHLVTDILQLIQEGVVLPGAKLPTESELASRFAVSRTVVREAISRLQASGIVRTHQGRGTFVLATPDGPTFPVIDAPTGSLADMLELLEFRTAVEVEAAGLAAARRTSEQLGQIAAALADFAQSGDPAAAVEADFQFHLRVAWATGNARFPQLLQSLGHAMLSIPRARLAASGAHALAHDEHTRVHEAIAGGDVVAARAAMRVHLVDSGRRLAQP